MQTPMTKPKRLHLHVGSRPFETKRSYLEFLDTFYSVGFSKVLEVMAGKDKTSAQPFLRSFARDIVDREMLFFVQRVAGTAHKKPQGLAVITGRAAQGGGQDTAASFSSHPKRMRGHSVPGRTSGRLGDEDAGQIRGSRPVGLFRGKSMVETTLERSHACVKSYGSEPDNLDDPDLSLINPKSSQPQPGLAHRFSQSEEALYGLRPGMGQADNSGWSLTVNFGKKYTALQQLLEWLEVWGNKPHVLGLGPGQEEVLNSGNSHLMHHRAPGRTASASPQAVGSRHSSPATPPPGPAQASTLEEDRIIDAYTQVLEDGTSSPGKENSVLNHTIFPKDESPERGAPKPQNSSTPKQAKNMPDQRTPSVSPARTSQHGTQDKSVSEHASRSETGRRNSRRQQREVHHQGSQAHEQQTSHVQAVGEGIASQLQGIIRDELRRIMEVQHRSVLAMMGALDEVGGTPGLGPAPQAMAPPPQLLKNTSTSQHGRWPRPPRSHSQNQAAGQGNVENQEDESVAEMVSFKVTVESDALKPSQSLLCLVTRK
ncbi:hypothetical protein PoB_004750500 [Plakobranchus ocellatus]|uniref:Uncharacterized protein n=1 Tax=Plakobranchus ocellatus TaxID=259542 RepID=A0AAV4BPG2_9GAST|nr:hypothetical protein PoB_004750500 [Plakobranchus ocellatus]